MRSINSITSGEWQERKELSKYLEIFSGHPSACWQKLLSMTREGHFQSLLRALFDCLLLSAFFHYLKDEEIFKVIFAAHFSAFYHNFVFYFFSHVTMSKSEHQSEKNSSSKDISTSSLLYKIKTQREMEGRLSL